MIQLKLITPTQTFILDPLDGLIIPSNMQLNDSLQHQEAQVSVRVAYDVEVLNSLIENSELQAQLLDNNIPIFSGIIDTGVSWTDNGNPEPLENIPLVINDNTYKLQQTTEDEFACINLSLAEITRRICLNCGLSFKENSKAESVIIPAFVLKAEQEYYQAFSDLLFEYKFTFGFTPDGKLCLIDLDAELDNIELSDLYSGVKVQKTKKKFTGVKLTYGKLTAKENEQIYFEGGNLNEDSKVVPYIITPGSYYPIEATPVLEEENGQVYQDFAQGFAETKTLYNGEKRLQRSQNTELIYTTNHYLVEDWTENLSVDRTDFKYTQASVRFYNASDTDAELRQLAIRATAYYRSEAEYILGTGKKYSYDTSYIYDTQNATNFADFLSKYFLGGNLKITFKTDKELTPGQKIKINTNTFSANVKVLAVNHNYTFNVYEITAITEQIVSLPVKKNQTQSSMSANQQLQRTEISAELIDSIIEEYYLSDSRTELINGTWQTTPVVPTNKQYVWTRTTFIYSDGSKTTTEPISVSGASGSSGTDGNSIEYVDVEYAQNQSRTTAPTTGWQTTAPTAKDGYYIWTRTKVKIQNEEATYTQAVCITGDKGDKGEQGIQGVKGDTGAKGADGKNAIVMTSAATPNGEYNGQVGMYKGQFYTWNGSSWILSSGILPTDPVLHYSFDDLPDLPDGTSILALKNGRTYDTINSFPNNGTVLKENINGNIRITSQVANSGFYYRATSATANDVVKIKIKTISGTIRFFGIEGYNTISNRNSGEYIFPFDDSHKTFICHGNEGTVFEVEEFYIGDASYTTPIIDNSGNNYNATDVKGLVTKGVSGNSYRTLQNGYVVAKSPLNWNSQYEYSFSTWIKRYTSSVYIANNWNSYSVSTLFLTLHNYADNNFFSRVDVYTKEDKVNRYIANLTLPPIGEWFHYVVTVKDGVAVVYINGENQNFKLDYPTEGFHKQTPDLLQIGRIFSESDYVTYDAKYDDFQIFDRALSDQEVLGLYLARGNTPKRYTMADYQNFINGGKYHSTTKPTMAFEGDYYLNTTDGYIYSYDGTTWVKITDYNDARYKIAMTDMINLAATNPNVPFIAVTNAWIKNLAAGNILANEIATKELKLTGDGVIKSENYNTGISGFKIFSNGDAEFNNGVIKTPELNFAGVKGLDDNLLKNGYRLKPIFNDWGQGYFGEEPVYRCAGYDSDGKVVALYLGCSYELSFSGTLNIYLAKNEHIYCSEICKSVNFRTVISDVSADNVSPYPIIGSSVRNVLAFTNTSSKFWSANVADKIFSVSVKAGQYITCFVEALLSAPAENVGTIYSKSIENSGTSNAYKESALYIKKENKIAKDLLKGNEKVFNESIFLTRGTGVYDVRGVGSFGNYFIIGNVLVQWGQTMSYTVPSGQYFIETINLPIAYNDAGDVVGNATGLDGYSVIMSSSTKNNGGGMEYAEIWERRTNSSFTVRTYNRNESTTIESWSLRWMTIGYLN